jgi:hypothetical protein
MASTNLSNLLCCSKFTNWMDVKATVALAKGWLAGIVLDLWSDLLPLLGLTMAPQSCCVPPLPPLPLTGATLKILVLQHIIMASGSGARNTELIQFASSVATRLQRRVDFHLNKANLEKVCNQRANGGSLLRYSSHFCNC